MAAEAIKAKASAAAEQAEYFKGQLAEQIEKGGAEEVLEARGINALLGRAVQPGDAGWERAVAALDLTYVTPRVIAMGMPYDRRQEMLDRAREAVGAGGVARRRAGAPSAEKPGCALLG